MRSHLLWKLLGVIVSILVVTVAIEWLAIEFLAGNYFNYILASAPDGGVKQEFLHTARGYLLWVSLARLSFAIVLGYALFKRVFRPVYRMIEMSESLRRIDQLRKKMIVDVAHELRAPLTNMCGYLEGLRDGIVPPSPKTFESLHEETLRLAAFAEDLLQLNHADAARSSLRLQDISLSEFLPRKVDPFRAQLAAKSIAVEVGLPTGLNPVAADPGKLAQVICNLMQNACQYTPVGGNISISAEQDIAGTKIVFANTGDMIAAADLPYLFERFYRTEKSRFKGDGGAGIGLAIVKELVEAHDGCTGADSSLEGNTIWFTLPRSPVPDERDLLRRKSDCSAPGRQPEDSLQGRKTAVLLHTENADRP